MYKLLITRTIPEECVAPLRSEFEIIMPDEAKAAFSDAEVLELVADADAMLTIATRGTKEIMDAGKKLKAIGNLGVGYDNIDWKYATEKGIAVINTPTTVTEATAELAVSLMLAIARWIPQYDARLRRDGTWSFHTFFDSEATRIYGLKLGILGFGRIGKAFARKAKGLGMTLCYYDPFRATPEVEAEYGIEYMSFEDVLKVSDVITLHLPYMPETHHLMSTEQFKLMKPTAYFVNASRGPVVDEAALIEALKNGVIKGAGLDVFEYEPKISPELLTLPNVVMTPHVGTYSRAVRVDMGHEVLTGIKAVINGEKPYNCINKQVLK